MPNTNSEQWVPLELKPEEERTVKLVLVYKKHFMYPWGWRVEDNKGFPLFGAEASEMRGYETEQEAHDAAQKVLSGFYVARSVDHVYD